MGDGFPVRDLGPAHPGINLELPGQAVHDDFQMEFPHAGNDGFCGLRVGFDSEGGVFCGDLAQRQTQLVLIRLGLGLDGDVDDRVGNPQGFQDHRLAFVRQGVAGAGVFQTHGRHDVSGIGGVGFLPLVGVHLQQAPDALLAALGGVEHRAAGLQHPGVNP